ncbi:SPFH domain-containing protein [bacterium]|nr:SPFH domain-containing protein [bacterium]
MEEKPIAPHSPRPPLAVAATLGAAALVLVLVSQGGAPKATGYALGAAGLFVAKGFFFLNPGTAVVLRWFGTYAGTVRAESGPLGRWFWVSPLYQKQKIATWGRFQSEQLKVNDQDGSPIVISANLGYTLEDTARALFHLADAWTFVRLQSEAGIRSLAMRHLYDAPPGKRSLRGDPAILAQELRDEVQSHMAGTGIRIADARIVHLAYAPEIVTLMLQAQQAGAAVAASRAIVENAVQCAEAAIRRLAHGMDEEQRARWVHDLMVALTSQVAARPVLDTTAE